MSSGTTNTERRVCTEGNKRGNTLEDEESSDVKERREKRGEGVSFGDLGKDEFEEPDTSVDVTVRFPELRMVS